MPPFAGYRSNSHPLTSADPSIPHSATLPADKSAFRFPHWEGGAPAGIRRPPTAAPGGGPSILSTIHKFGTQVKPNLSWCFGAWHLFWCNHLKLRESDCDFPDGGRLEILRRAERLRLGAVDPLVYGGRLIGRQQVQQAVGVLRFPDEGAVRRADEAFRHGVIE